MKVLILLIVTFVNGGFSAELGNIDSPVDYTLAKIQESDVTFTYYNNSVTDYQVVTAGNLLERFEQRMTVFIIHGFAENGNLEWVQNIRDNYLTVGYYNIIVVDWSKAADNYEIGASNTRKLGEYIGDFILNNKIPLATTHIVGSCLGGQAAGQAGKYIFRITGQKLMRISGVDVAGHKFEGSEIPETNKLQPTDAFFVDVTHTDARSWGFKTPIGSVDFYANSGNVQPGCPTNNFTAQDICSHVRGNYLFAESILYTSLAVLVDIVVDLDLVIATKSFNTHIAVYGQWTSPATEGSYTFKTNEEPDYLINDGGIF